MGDTDNKSINNQQKMNKTAKTEFRRLFLIEDLPDPLTRASAHLQFFDNYIENTRLRLRSIRVPETKEWTRILQQRDAIRDGELKIAEMYLNDAEYAVFERFEGREIRKNRYFHEFDEKQIAFDVFLGDLWGLNMALVDFETIEEMSGYDPPRFMIFEVTGDSFFRGENLVGNKFADIQRELEKVSLPQMASQIAED
jgi:CYTH domain-containing protein